MIDDLKNIKNDLRDYIEVRLDLLKLQVAESISGIISKTVIISVVAILLVFILLFLSVAAGYFFASLLNSKELGFLCVAGIYLFVLLVFLLLKRKIVERPVIKSVVKIFFSKSGDN